MAKVLGIDNIDLNFQYKEKIYGGFSNSEGRKAVLVPFFSKSGQESLEFGYEYSELGVQGETVLRFDSKKGFSNWIDGIRYIETLRNEFIKG